MKLKLEALSQAEGIGIVRSGQTLRLVRPPYSLRDAPVLPEDSLQDAILRHGFSGSDQQFETWEDAIAFLNQQAVVARRALGKEIPDAIPHPDILDLAPTEVLIVFLDRVETELIPQRLFEHAEAFLLALLKSDAPSRQPELCRRAVELLQLNSEARKKADARFSDLASRDVRFTALERKRDDLEWSIRMSDMIRERGCVFV